MQKNVSPVLAVIVILVVVVAVGVGWWLLTQEPSATTPPVESRGQPGETTRRDSSRAGGLDSAPAPDAGGGQSQSQEAEEPTAPADIE